MRQIIAHVDMDCFYCSCEMLRRTELKGKAVVVGKDSERGVAAAANYEARRYGIYSATPIAKAKMLCPDIIIIPADKQYYSKISKEIMYILKRISDNMQQVSIDEAYLDITTIGNKIGLKETAKHIKSSVKTSTGLTCSVGIAGSRMAAKIASDFEKPDGITIVEDTKSFLHDLPIEKIPGIGKVSKERYNSEGIITIGDLSHLDRYTVMKKFGKHALKYHDLSIGNDRSGIIHKSKRKSVSNECTFQTDVADIEKLKISVKEISEKIYKRLHGTFRTVSVKLKYNDFRVVAKDRSFLTPRYSLEDITDTAYRLLEEMYKSGRIRLIGVRVANLSEGSRQTLLTDYVSENKCLKQ